MTQIQKICYLIRYTAQTRAIVTMKFRVKNVGPTSADQLTDPTDNKPSHTQIFHASQNLSVSVVLLSLDFQANTCLPSSPQPLANPLPPKQKKEKEKKAATDLPLLSRLRRICTLPVAISSATSGSSGDNIVTLYSRRHLLHLSSCLNATSTSTKARRNRRRDASV